MKLYTTIIRSSILIIVLFVNLVSAGPSQMESTDDERDAVRTIPEGMVHIINSVNAKIFFSLSYDGENWREIDLDANHSDVFEFANYIKISTKLKAGTAIKTYKLEQSRRYRIIWNAEDRFYDVVKLSNT